MKVRFGIIGTGFIAQTFVDDSQLVENCVVKAVTSRTKEKADLFADKNGVEFVFEDYDEMLASEIDAVYIAAPHAFHHDFTIRALNAGKAVLCEKPFALNSNESQEMIDASKANQKLLMEGMWTRFFPAYKKMKLMLEKLGDILFIKADFGFRSGEDEPASGRLLNPELGGGALLDVGIYPVSVVRDIMGCDPINIKCTQMLNDDGVDLMSTYNYMFENGALATLYSAIQVQTQTELFISGTNGTIQMPNFFCPEQLIFTRHDGYQEAFNYPKQGHGYVYEIEHFCDLYLSDKLESPVIPLHETMVIMNMIDQVEVKIGYLNK
jgi:predicted dehydrogenase